MSRIEISGIPGSPDGPAHDVMPPKALVAQSRTLRDSITAVLAAPDQRRRGARSVYDGARREIPRQQPLARLKETTQGRLRLGVIESAGYQTVDAAGPPGGGATSTALEPVTTSAKPANNEDHDLRLEF